MKKKSFLLAAFSWVLLLGIGGALWNCSGGWDWPTPKNENSTAADIQVLGHAYDPFGNPAKIVSVTAFPVHYHAPSPYSREPQNVNLPVEGNITGNTFEFLGIDTGFYNFIAEDSLGYKCLVESLLIIPGAQSQLACTLQAPGSLLGIATDSLCVLPESSFVYIQGTGYFTYVINPYGQFSFLNLPAGSISLGGQSKPGAQNLRPDSTFAFVNSPISTADFTNHEFPAGVYPQTAAEGDPELSIAPNDTTYIWTKVK